MGKNTMLETLAETLPPVLEIYSIPEYARNYTDKWGNIKKPPEKTIEQCKAGDFIKIFIYSAEPGFYYGFQVKLRKLVKQKEANIINDSVQKTADAALYSARRELVSIVNNYSKKLVKTFLTFDRICYNQIELF